MKPLIPIIVLVVLLVPVLVFSQQPKDCKTDADCPLEQFCNQTVFQCQPRTTEQPSPGSFIIIPPTETPVSESSPTTPQPQGCVDSDVTQTYPDGYNFKQAGVVTTNNVQYQDFCQDENDLKEYYCLDNSFTSTTVNCKTVLDNPSFMCFQGACVDSSQIKVLNKESVQVESVVL